MTITPPAESDELNPFALFIEGSSPVFRLGDDEDEEWDDEDDDDLDDDDDDDDFDDDEDEDDE